MVAKPDKLIILHDEALGNLITTPRTFLDTVFIIMDG